MTKGDPSHLCPQSWAVRSYINVLTVKGIALSLVNLTKVRDVIAYHVISKLGYRFLFPVVEVECVDVVEVLAVAEVVVEAAEDDQVPLQQHHPVTRPGRGASRGTES